MYMAIKTFGIALLWMSICFFQSCLAPQDVSVLSPKEAEARGLVTDALPIIQELRDEHPLGRDWFAYFANPGYPLIWNSSFGVYDRYIVTLQLTLDRKSLLEKGIVAVEKADISRVEVRLIRVLEDGRTSISYAQHGSDRVTIDREDDHLLKQNLPDTLRQFMHRIPVEKDPIEDFQLAIDDG